MSDFSFNNSTRPGQASAFQRLASGNVNGSPNQPTRVSSEGSQQSRVEQETKAPDDAATKSIFNNLSGLESSVRDLKDSKDTLGTILGSSDEVVREIQAASSASVRDVEEAARLADEISSQIEGSEQVAKDAQAGGLTPERVSRALR